MFLVSCFSLAQDITVAPLKHHQVRIETEPQNSSGPAFAAGAVHGRNQITERQRLLVVGLHEMRMNREGARGNYGVNRGVFPPSEVFPNADRARAAVD